MSLGSRSPLVRTLLAPFVLTAAGCVWWTLNIVGSGDGSVSWRNRDWFTEFLPRHHLAGEMLSRGELGLWDPHQITGLPFLATLQGGLLYPPNWIYAVVPAGAGMSVLGLLHLLMAGGLTFLLCRELGCSRWARALGSVVFMLGGATVLLIYQTNAIHSAAWIPGALLCAIRLGRDPRLRWALALGTTMALQFLVGRDYTFVMTANAVALLAAFQVSWKLADGEGARAAGRHVVLLGLAAVIAAGLAAPQLLPTLDLAEQTHRTISGLDATHLEPIGPLPPSMFVANLIHPVRGPLRPQYFGFVPLLLALLGLRFWGRDRGAVFASTLALLALLLSFGSLTPLYDVYRLLPLGSSFRLPDRFVLLFSMALAILSARGFDRVGGMGCFRGRPTSWTAVATVLAGSGLLLAWLLGGGWLRSGLEQAMGPWSWGTVYGFHRDHFDGLARSVIYLLGAGALVLALRSPRRPRALVPLLVCVAAGDLVWALESRVRHPSASPGLAASAEGCYERASRISGSFGRHLSFPVAGSYALKDKDGQLFSGFSATHYEPMVTRRHASFFAAAQTDGAAISGSPWTDRVHFMGFLYAYPSAQGRKLLDLIGTRAVLADGRAGSRPRALSELLARLEPRDRCSVTTVSGEVPVEIYESPSALDRTFVVHRVTRVADAEEALERLLDDGFDPREEALIEADLTGKILPPPADQPSLAEIVTYSPSRVVVRASSATPGLLVLADAYDPDWHATRDGQATPIVPTDGLLRGVWIPSGDSVVEFVYVPRAFHLGAGLAALTGTAIVATCLWRVRSARRRSSA